MADFIIKTEAISLPFLLCLLGFVLSGPVAAQKIAIITPDKTDASRAFGELLADHLASRVSVVDLSLSDSAYTSVSPATPFNLTNEESKRIGQTIGCDVFLLIKTATQRRSDSQRPEYYETYAAIFVVSSRSGRLAAWKLQQFEAAKPADAEQKLANSVKALSDEITEHIRTALKNEFEKKSPIAMEEVPDENSPAAKNFKAPIPYRRIKPEYTAQASLYDVTATVEVLVDLGASGIVMRTEIVRWAGFGLDESADKAVRSMNWRPAERGGKPLPMRFLVRYNFRKVENSY